MMVCYNSVDIVIIFCSILFKIAEKDHFLVRYLTKACRHGLDENLNFDEGIIQCLVYYYRHKVRSACKINKMNY